MEVTMKVVAIGKNYAAHIAELNDERPKEPVVFLKTATALTVAREIVFEHPEFSDEVHHEVELVLRISKTASRISADHALSYCDGLGIGIDFTARDLQRQAKAKGMPWTLSKAFDGAAPVSLIEPIESFGDLDALSFALEVNGETRQSGDTTLMLYDFKDLLSYVSHFMTFEPGDLLFTGTPAGVASVKPGDLLVASIEGTPMLDVKVV